MRGMRFLILLIIAIPLSARVSQFLSEISCRRVTSGDSLRECLQALRLL